MKKIFPLLLSLTILVSGNKASALALDSYYSREILLEKLPASLHSCIPVEIAQARIQSIMEVSNNEYYYLIGLVPNDSVINTIFHLKNGICQQRASL